MDHDGRGMGVVAAHLDEDDLIDLYVANDATANFLFRNLGNLRFEDRAFSPGPPARPTERPSRGWAWPAAMRIATAVSTWRSRISSTNRPLSTSNLGDGSFNDVTHHVGLAHPTRNRLGFGIAFLDYDCDGILDMATANGHVNDLRPGVPYPMRAQLLAGTP